jgi:hypothetical protein
MRRKLRAGDALLLVAALLLLAATVNELHGFAIAHVRTVADRQAFAHYLHRAFNARTFRVHRHSRYDTVCTARLCARVTQGPGGPKVISVVRRGPA